MESRLLQNFQQTHKNMRAIHDSMDHKTNLVLNIQDESMIDMIASQQKSNKNASVKSKRSVCHSTSATNKRKKSMNKRKQSN